MRRSCIARQGPREAPHEHKRRSNPTSSLADKFDLAKPRQLLNGMQAIVRLVLMQKARDQAAGLNTAGYITGYRGSPIATIESAFARAGDRVAAADILFQPAVNEDLAATALWGSQQAELRGEGRFDGVFGVWYGKGPGVDRSGDALRHANHAGTSPHGGVIALMGDDHTCESSTSAHQSEFAFVDAMIPVLAPSDVQDLIDFGLIGFALSRYAGVWVGLKCVKDTVESTAVVDASQDRIAVRLPDEREFRMPPGGLNIRLGDTPLEKEARLHIAKRAAVLAFARSNGLDRIVLDGGPAPRIGLIAAGKSYTDTRQALDLLGIDEARAAELGIRLLKVAMVWPLEPEAIARFASGLDLVIVVEEKRSLIETQIKEQLYNAQDRPQIIGKRDEKGSWLFPASGALDPLQIAIAIGERLAARTEDGALFERIAALRQVQTRRAFEPDPAQRRAYFCAGCPHNTSTRVPDGARAYAGIGCHYMVQWMDRATEGFTQMGGEGANWIGEAPFSKRAHMFQNIGDGTFVHSGSLAMRAAIASGVNITFKLLYNDAVAMTGGQHLEGNMSVGQMARQLLAEGARQVVVVTDEPGKYRPGALPPTVPIRHRRDLDAVQRELAAVPGTTVVIYDQVCAAEKRRRRKRGAMPDPARRVAINHLVCEGCGDCGVQSNCVAVVPRETELGRKRAIDQSACNKDYSCIEGLCPSFVTVEGGVLPRPAPSRLDHAITHLPEPERPILTRPVSIVATGIGGTGVVTITAVLGQAAFLAGLGFGAIDMTGIAQKGGPVVCHMRLAPRPEDIHAIRTGSEGADVLIGGDLVVSSAAKVLEMVAPGRTRVVLSPHAATSGEFTREPDLEVPTETLKRRVRERCGDGPPQLVDAHDIALRLLGDTIYANLLLVGFAYQKGLIPVSSTAIDEAIKLNGVDVEANRQAFRLGRLAAADADALARLLAATPSESSATDKAQPLQDLIRARAADLVAYQDDVLAERYRERVQRIAAAERRAVAGSSQLARVVALAYYKALAIKDEYEVARLYTDGRFAADLAAHFGDAARVELHLAPPLLARVDRRTKRPTKIRFGAWILPLLKILANGKRLRGGPFDLFARTQERKAERAFIAEYEAVLDRIEARLRPATMDAALALASLPLEVRGFGVVKMQAIESAAARREELLRQLDAIAPGQRRGESIPDYARGDAAE